MRDPNCEGSQIEQVHKPCDVMVARHRIALPLGAENALDFPKKPREPPSVQPKTALQRICQDPGECREHSAAQKYGAHRYGEQAASGVDRKHAVPQCTKPSPERKR